MWTHCEFQLHNDDHFRRERREVWRQKRKVRIFGKGKCKHVRHLCELLARESVNSSPILARQWWRHFRLSLYLSLSLSLSLSPKVPHAQYRKRFRASYNTNIAWQPQRLLDNWVRGLAALGPIFELAMQNYVMLCDVRSWRASGVMFDKTHCDRRSNNDWQDPLRVLVDEYLVDFLLKDDSVVEHCLRSCPRQVQEVELETFTSRSWSKGEWTDGRDTCVCSGRVLFSAGSKRPLSQDCDHELCQGDLAKLHD